MSSVSGETTESSGNNFIPEYRTSTIVSSQSTTDHLEIPPPHQDGRLKNQETSSEVVPVLSTISSLDVTNEQYNGGLSDTQEVQNSSVPINTSSDNSHNENGSSLKNARVDGSQRKLCRFYKNGFCRYGKNCRNSHSISKRPVPIERNAHVNKTNVKQNSSDQEHDTNKSKDDHGKQAIICKYFSRTGRCLYEESCRFSHQVNKPVSKQVGDEPESSNVEASLKNELVDENDSSGVTEVDSLQCKNTSVNFKSRRPCRSFYRYGDCRFGESCRYRHVKPKKDKIRDTHTENLESRKSNDVENSIDVNSEESKKDGDENLLDNLNDVETENNKESEPGGNEKLLAKQAGGHAPKPVLLRNKKRSDMTQADFAKLRVTEITQLKRKYPKCSETSIPDIGTVFNLEFVPTDPDWRFDVKSVNINVMIPDTYPEENLQVDLQNEEGILPEKLVRYFNKITFTWLEDQQEKNKLADEVLLIFRPFIKWLDKTLEDIFIGGLKMVKREMEAKAAGLEFVTHEELNTNNKNKTAKPEDDPIPFEEEEEMYSSIPEYDDPVPHFEDMSSQSVLMENVVDYRSVVETPKRGTEIKFRNLQLLEAAASLTCSKMSITVQCGRCKMRSDISVAPHRSHRVVCERCHHQQKLVFRPQMLHQFSSVAGYLDLDNCEVIDVPLLTCEFAVQCLPCGRQNFLSGVQYGQSHTTWCLFCHSKMAITVESTKLNQLQPNVEPVIAKAGQLLKLEKKEKRVKDPTVQEGKPLPDNGTCKHYKKSFRWFRFPCCGKTYPCDTCHDEKETDHEMKLATRVLCGFCAKEQPFSVDRPCVSCSSNMSKKTGTHWEGGKGCRDKIKMSKDDKQKYAGTNKTVSKKSTALPKK